MSANDRNRKDQQVQSVALELHGQGGALSYGQVEVVTLTGMGRFKRAGKTAAVLFLLAIASAPIPPIHWVLVPGFLIASIIAFFVRLGTSALVSGDVQCPKCQQSFPLERQPPTWPLALTCHHCRAQLQAQPVP